MKLVLIGGPLNFTEHDTGPSFVPARIVFPVSVANVGMCEATYRIECLMRDGRHVALFEGFVHHPLPDEPASEASAEALARHAAFTRLDSANFTEDQRHDIADAIASAIIERDAEGHA